MRVALIHDWLTGRRGGEKVLEVLLELFPQADIFTLFHFKGSQSRQIEEKEIRTSFLQKMPFLKRFYRYYLPLFPAAVESFDLRGYDLIISSSHCVAKGAIPPPEAKHICYCHSPMRYAWDVFWDYFPQKGVKNRLIALQISRLRLWDVASSQRIDRFIANSNYVKQRIWRYYRREAEVVHPPIDTDFFSPAGEGKEDFYLVVSALVQYKKVELIVEAFRELKRKLVIVGKGPLYSKIKRRLPSWIELRKEVSDEELRSLYCRARALIHMAKEDFGMNMAEAQACATPVIAYRVGGAADIVREGTGVLVDRQEPAALRRAIEEFESLSFDAELIRRNGLRFSKENFKVKIKEIVKEVTG